MRSLLVGMIFLVAGKLAGHLPHGVNARPTRKNNVASFAASRRTLPGCSQAERKVLNAFEREQVFRGCRDGVETFQRFGERKPVAVRSDQGD